MICDLDAELVAFGSLESGLALKNSDMDLCVLMDTRVQSDTIALQFYEELIAEGKYNYSLKVIQFRQTISEYCFFPFQLARITNYRQDLKENFYKGQEFPLSN